METNVAMIDCSSPPPPMTPGRTINPPPHSLLAIAINHPSDDADDANDWVQETDRWRLISPSWTDGNVLLLVVVIDSLSSMMVIDEPVELLVDNNWNRLVIIDRFWTPFESQESVRTWSAPDVQLELDFVLVSFTIHCLKLAGHVSCGHVSPEESHQCCWVSLCLIEVSTIESWSVESTTLTSSFSLYYSIFQSQWTKFKWSSASLEAGFIESKWMAIDLWHLEHIKHGSLSLTDCLQDSMKALWRTIPGNTFQEKCQNRNRWKLFFPSLKGANPK